MLTEEQFSVLLQRPESETLDFKQEGYNLSRDDQKFAFIKDVLCMANTPRNDDSHIVLGVKKYPDGKFDLLGLDSHVDEADLQSQFSERVHPVPRFSYELVFYQGNNYGVVSIPPERIGPYVPIKDYGNGNFLRQRQIYFRRGSKNDVADSGDVMRIANWINSDDVSTGHVTEQKLDSLEWGKFVDVVQGFATSR